MERTTFWRALCAIATILSGVAAAQPRPVPEALAGTARPQATRLGRYVVIGWNDLGMHCISPRFSEMAILPPYNTFWALVIERGEDPRLINHGVDVTYSFVNNKSVAKKTDFWTYAPKLFGKQIPAGVGLTGLGLSGSMPVAGDHFQATGVPVLPYTDNMKWNPYQTAVVKVTGPGINISTSFTVPVSDEMNCAKCHGTGGVANLGMPTVESNIIKLHDRTNKTHLYARRPVLCASCHSDNALGAKGTKGLPSLSLAMHGKHASVSPQPTCYDCHPGSHTQCNRSAIPAMGPNGRDPQCARCHGDLTQMATSLRKGRQPWLQEPTCAQCHGKAYSTGKVLFRNAKGHGGIYCAACHNSPHAWYPSRRSADNVQPLNLQGNTKSLGYNGCSICHDDGRKGTMPPHWDD